MRENRTTSLPTYQVTNFPVYPLTIHQLTNSSIHQLLLVPPDRLFRQIDIHLFDVQVLLDAPLAELAADAALLVAAPWRFDVGRLHVIHPHDAGPQVPDGSHRPKDVTRPDRGGKTEVGVVRDPQRIGLVVEWNDARDGSEDFLARDPIRVVHVVEDRRLDEVAVLEIRARRPASAECQLGFLLTDVLIRAHAIELLPTDERAHFRRAVERRSNRNAPRLLDHGVDELLVNRPLHQNAASRGAQLALVEEHTEQGAFDGCFEVGVGE